MTTAGPMRAWWVSDCECYAGRSAAEAYGAAVADWGADPAAMESAPIEEVREAGPNETMSMSETGTPPLFNIRGEAAKMTEPGFICGTET